MTKKSLNEHLTRVNKQPIKNGSQVWGERLFCDFLVFKNVQFVITRGLKPPSIGVAEVAIITIGFRVGAVNIDTNTHVHITIRKLHRLPVPIINSINRCYRLLLSATLTASVKINASISVKRD